MTRVFADTGYWIALLNTRDELHEKATGLAERFSTAEIFTSQMVLVELLNAFSEYGRHLREAAASAVEALRSMPQVVIIPQSGQQFEVALRQYKQASDKHWSLTDCASFQIMREQVIEAAMTYDRHFVQAGFQALLR